MKTLFQCEANGCGWQSDDPIALSKHESTHTTIEEMNIVGAVGYSCNQAHPAYLWIRMMGTHGKMIDRQYSSNGTTREVKE